MRAARASDNAHLQQAPLGPHHADVASKQPVARDAHRPFITRASVIDQIPTHLRTRAAHATHAGEVDDRAVCSTIRQPTPIEIPIPH